MENARELTTRLHDLLRREHSALAEFLVALAEFDERRLWVKLGYSSLFYFLHRELRLSAGAAYLRKTAAEIIQRFPEVADPLRDGRLCLSSVGELAKVVTAENRAELVPRFFHASKQQAKVVAAELAPREASPMRMVVTSVTPHSPARTADQVAPAAAPQLSSGSPPSVSSAAADAASGRAFHPGETSVFQAPAPRSTAEPLTADLRRLHVTVSKRFMEKLEAAKDALSHSHPGAEAEAILEAGLDLLIERAAKRKGIVAKPRKPPTSVAGARPSVGPEGNEAGERAIPAAVRREVWIRDGGRCQWPTSDGGVCGSTCRVQFDHIVPVARGGKATVANLRLACAGHNNLAARRSSATRGWIGSPGAHTSRRPPWRRREGRGGETTCAERRGASCNAGARACVAAAGPPRDEPLLARTRFLLAEACREAGSLARARANPMTQWSARVPGCATVSFHGGGA